MQSDMQEYLKFYTLHPQIKCKTHLIWNENPVLSWEPALSGLFLALKKKKKYLKNISKWPKSDELYI